MSIRYTQQTAWVRFVGTHTQYDQAIMMLTWIAPLLAWKNCGRQRTVPRKRTSWKGSLS
ncbi:type II toxin-antitoxin system HigB family toxin [Halomonas endophytica]|uniref:type II toxin-antitoxin system HigB family toxin n=1 Tax=Billgrantia endophytica TaxID=2033802 RepID=UPI00197ADEDB